MSGSTDLNLQYFDTNWNPISVVCLRDDGFAADGDGDGCPDTPANLPLDQGARCEDVANFHITVSDVNGNAPPNGTTIDATSSLGSMLGTSSYTVPNTLQPYSALFSIQEACGGVPQALIEVQVTTPNGIKTIETITVLDDG
jgi:hypothetical protein